jgi:D-3-phosphoglycerate dehydrogenase
MKIALIDNLHPSFTARMSDAGVVCVDLTTTPPAALPEALKECDGIAMRSRISITNEFLDTVPNIRFIARSGAGMEHIDQEACAARGVTCYSSPEGNCEAVGEHALGMLLALMNRIHLADRSVRQGKWEREIYRGFELSGLTVGVIGYGHIGSSFAHLLRGFNVSVLAHDIGHSDFDLDYVHPATVKEIMDQADVLSIHTPLTELTEQMVNEEFINGFRKPFWFINTARGRIVNTENLLDAIDAGKVLGAALDVSEFEDSSFQRLGTVPEVLKRAWQNPNILFTPHIAGWTVESKRKLAEILARKIINDMNNGKIK